MSEKIKVKKSTLMKRTIPYIKLEKKLFLLTVLFCILSALLSASTPFITKNILDTFLPNNDYNMIIILLGVYFGIIITLFAFRYAFQYVNTLTGMRIEKRLRERAMVKINELPVDYFSLEPDGKIVSKILSDSSGVKTFYTTFMSVANALINVLVVYISIIIMEPMLGLFVLALIPVIILWITVYRKFARKFFVRVREISSRITGKLNEDITGALIVQSFNQERKITGEYKELVNDYVHNERVKNGIYNVFGFELLSLIKRVAVICLLMYMGFSTINAAGVAITLGLVSALVENLDKMVNPMNTIFNNLNELEDSMVGAMRCYDFIDEENDVRIADGKIAPDKIHGDVEFKNVSFEYVKDNPVIKDLSLNVKSGQTIGIVGHTGSGKSTLMNLLLGFNNYDSGSILIDGMELSGFNKTSIRAHMGIVLQTPALFEGTVRSNITMDRPYSDDEIYNALKQVDGLGIIKNSPEGLDMPVSFRGENLSLGEKQLISFARIILRNPEILVLDEATANIDTETETNIQSCMKAVSEGRTTFVIAHRLSTVKNADMIVVLDHGTIKGLGNHLDLYKNCEAYKDMYDAQFKNN